MKTASDLIRDLKAIGAELDLHLVVEAPAGTIDADMEAAILEHAPAILASLASGAQRAGMVATRAGDDDGRPAVTSSLHPVQQQDCNPAETAADDDDEPQRSRA